MSQRGHQLASGQKQRANNEVTRETEAHKLGAYRVLVSTVAHSNLTVHGCFGLFVSRLDSTLHRIASLHQHVAAALAQEDRTSQ